MSRRPNGDYRSTAFLLTPGTLEEIDRRRGRESRSAYVERLVRDQWARSDFRRPRPSSIDRDMHEFFGVPL